LTKKNLGFRGLVVSIGHLLLVPLGAVIGKISRLLQGFKVYSSNFCTSGSIYIYFLSMNDPWCGNQ